jgi:hypothetical protein
MVSVRPAERVYVPLVIVTFAASGIWLSPVEEYATAPPLIVRSPPNALTPEAVLPRFNVPAETVVNPE